MLKKYLVPKVDIERFIDEVRQDGYQMLRSLSGKSPTFQDIKLHCYDAEIANLRVESGAFLAGKTLGEADLRNQYGVSILLIQRGADTIINPGADVTLEAGDQAVLLGTPDRIKAMTQLLGGSFRRNRMEAPSRDEVSRGWGCGLIAETPRPASSQVWGKHLPPALYSDSVSLDHVQDSISNW